MVTVRTTCKSASGDEYERSHIVDLSELKGVSRLGTPPLLTIARHVQKVQEDFHRFATGGFRRLRVDTYSQADRNREHEEWEAQSRELEREKGERNANSMPQPPTASDG